MGFLGMTTSIPCMTDEVKLITAKRITTIMGEKRVCRLCSSISILCCPVVYWPFTRKRPSPQAFPLRDQLETHSYADLKLGHMVPNLSPESVMNKLTCSDFQALLKFCILILHLLPKLIF